MPRTCVMGCAITDHNRLHAFPKSQDRYNIWLERLCGGYPPSRSDLHACRRHFHKRFHYQWALAKTALPEYFLHPNSNYVAPEEYEGGGENKDKYISSKAESQPLRKHSGRVPIMTLTQPKSIQTDNVEPLQLQHNTETVSVMNMRPQQHHIQPTKIVQSTVQVVPLEQSTISSMPRKVIVLSDNGIPVNSKMSMLQNVPVIPVTAATPAIQPLSEVTTTTVHTMCETRDIDEQQLVEIILPEIHVKDLKEGILLYQSDNMVTLEFLKPEYNNTLPSSTNNQQKDNKEKETNEMNTSLKFMDLTKKIALEDKAKDTSIVKNNQSTCKISQMQTKKDDTIINVKKSIKIQDHVKINGVIKILKMSTLNVNKPVSNVNKLSLIVDSNHLQNGTEQECNTDKNIVEEKEKCSETKDYKKANPGSVHQVTDLNQNLVNLYAKHKSKEKYVNLDKQKLIESHEEHQNSHDLNEDDEKVGFTEEQQDESQVAALEQEEDDVSGKLNIFDLSEAQENDKNQNNEKGTNFKDRLSTEESHNDTTADVHINSTHEEASPLIWFDQIEIESYSNKNDNFSKETMSTQDVFLDKENHTKHDNWEGKNQKPLDSTHKENLEKLGCKENYPQNICEEHSELQINEIKDKEQKECERVNNETRHSDSKDEDDKRKPSGIVENETASDLAIISDHNCDTADMTATTSNDQHGKEEGSKHKMMSPVVDKKNKTPDASKWKIKIMPKGSLKPRILNVSRSNALGNSFTPIRSQLRQSTVLQQNLKRLSRTNRSCLSTKKLQLLKANLRDPLFVVNTNGTGINNSKISTILTTATEVAAPKHATPIPPPSLSTSSSSSTAAAMVTTPVMSQILQVTPKGFQQKINKEPNDSITKDPQNRKHKQQSLLKKKWYSDIVNKVEETPLQPCVEVQTDFRFQGICALVDTNRFHLNCFYCSEFYPLSLWPEFVQHIKTKHEIEKQSDNFISDHDYTPMTSPSEKKPSVRRLLIEKEIIINDNVEDNVSAGDDSKSSGCAFTKSRRNNLRELSAILQKKYCKTRKQSFKSGVFGKAHNQLKRLDNDRVAENTIVPIDDNNIIQDMTADIIPMPVQWEVIQQTPPIQTTRPKQVDTPLKIEQVNPLHYVATPQGVNSRLQRHEIIAQHSSTTSTNQQPINPSLDILQNYDNEDDLLKSKDGIGIVFGQTDHEVVIDFLLNLKNFPLLYKHQKECYQKDYDDAILRMCRLLNDKYQLDITDLELRRSIHRVTDWYCFTLDELERHNKVTRAKRWRTTPSPPYPHAFPEYFEICARFLPNTRVCDNLLMKNIAQVVCKRYNQPVIYPSWVKFLPIPQQADNKRLQANSTPGHKVNNWGSLLKRKLPFEEPLEENNEVRDENGTVLIKEQIELKKREVRKKPEGNVGKTRRQEKPKKILNNRVFKCETCGREFRDRCMFRIHKLRHLPPRFKCDKCTKEFYRNHQLQHHMRSRHATVPPFICEFCGKTVSSQNSLKIHIDNKHHNVRFHCVVCQYTTYTSSKLKKHQKKWHVAVEGTVEQLSRRKIAYGKFNMTSNGTELNHKATKLWLSSVRIPGIKNYTCTLCHLVFDNLEDIKRHNRHLHPIRCITYMCVLCTPSKMITRNNLRRHYQRIHYAHGDEITELMKRSKPVLALATGKDHPAEHDNIKTNVEDLYCDLMEQNENNSDQEACDIVDIKKEQTVEAVKSLKHEMCLRSSLDEMKIDDEYLETILEGTT